MRAVAFHRLRQPTIDLERNAPARAAAFVGHEDLVVSRAEQVTREAQSIWNITGTLCSRQVLRNFGAVYMGA